MSRTWVLENITREKQYDLLVGFMLVTDSVRVGY